MGYLPTTHVVTAVEDTACLHSESVLIVAVKGESPALQLVVTDSIGALVRN